MFLEVLIEATSMLCMDGQKHDHNNHITQS